VSCAGLSWFCSRTSPPARLGAARISRLLQTSALTSLHLPFVDGTVNIYTSLSWRFPFALQALTALVLTVLAPLMPYSPRWLMSKGRRDEAEKVLDLLLGTNDPADRKELLATGAGVIVGSKRAAFLEIWSKGVRGRTALGAFMNVFQQLAGM